jgi:phosphoribosylformimino-5-aminoimidazole carboxamide ribotide isomerase
VRLSQGDYRSTKVYNENPVEVAKQFEDIGLKYLHLVDLDGAKSRHIVNHGILEKIATETNLTIDFGGGIKSESDVRIAFESGAEQVTVGSTAVHEPALFNHWIQQYGSKKIILGADCLYRKVKTNGWLADSGMDVIDFIQNNIKMGVQYVVATDIASDGMLNGPAVDLYQEILAKTDVSLIASGGVSSMNDIRALRQIGCEGAIIGKAIYEGQVSLNDLGALC